MTLRAGVRAVPVGEAASPACWPGLPCVKTHGIFRTRFDTDLRLDWEDR